MKAEEMAKQQRSISISEFFEKNRHLLGYDNKIKALIMIVKEAVDNSLDATDESGILPDIYIKIRELEEEIYEIVIKDNGPGVVKKQIPRIFGRLLYGSKFHRLKQSRGQQGIGISAATLYSQLTTGKPLEIISSTGDGKIHKYKIKIDVRKNKPVIAESSEEEGVEWRGTQLRFVTEGVYRKGERSVPEYIKQTAISNPHANIIFDSPDGRMEFGRAVDELLKEPKEIKPHLYGMEFGVMVRLLQETKARNMLGFLTSEFTKVGRKSAGELCEKAGIDCKKRPRKLEEEEIKSMLRAIKEVKLLNPPTDCLSPLGNEAVRAGLEKELRPEWAAAVTRPPAVYRGWPFQIEAGIAYGGGVEGSKIMRLANRVPLLYQQGDCAITKSVKGINWKNYKLESRNLEEDPVHVFVHIISVWVPFVSESKEAIASYPVIVKEMKLALQECARKLKGHLSGKKREEYQRKRMSMFEKYSGEVVNALSELSGEEKVEVERAFMELISSKKRNIEEEANGGKEEAGGSGEESSGRDQEDEEPQDRTSRQVTLERLLR